LAELAELELHAGMASGQMTANANELVPRYALRGKVENMEAGPATASLLGAAVLNGRATLTLDVVGAGRTPAELLHQLSGKAMLAAPEGGKLPLDLKALRAAAKSNAQPGWGQMAKGQIGLEPFEVKATVQQGVLSGELACARSGSTGLAAVGRIDLTDQTLDLHLRVKPSAPTDRPLQPADVVDGQAIALRGPWLAAFRPPQDPLNHGWRIPLARC